MENLNIFRIGILNLDELVLTKILVNLDPRYVMNMLFLNKHFYNKLYKKHIFQHLIDAHHPGYIYTNNPIQQYINIHRKVKNYYEILDDEAILVKKEDLKLEKFKQIKVDEGIMEYMGMTDYHVAKNEYSLNKYMQHEYHRDRKKNRIYLDEDLFRLTGYPIPYFYIYGNPIVDMSNMIVFVRYTYSDKQTDTLVFRNREEMIKLIPNSIPELSYDNIIELIKEYMYNSLAKLQSTKQSDYSKNNDEKLQDKILYQERLNVMEQLSIQDIIFQSEFVEQLTMVGLPENISPLTPSAWHNFLTVNDNFYLDRMGNHYFYFIVTLSFTG